MSKAKKAAKKAPPKKATPKKATPKKATRPAPAASSKSARKAPTPDVTPATPERAPRGQAGRFDSIPACGRQASGSALVCHLRVHDPAELCEAELADGSIVRFDPVTGDVTPGAAA